MCHRLYGISTLKLNGLWMGGRWAPCMLCCCKKYQAVYLFRIICHQNIVDITHKTQVVKVTKSPGRSIPTDAHTSHWWQQKAVWLLQIYWHIKHNLHVFRITIYHNLTIFTNYYYYYNNNHFITLCPGLPGWVGTRRINHSGFCWSRDDGVALASAEPYASYLHFAPEDNHASTTSLIFTGQLLFLTPNKQRQSTKGTTIFAKLVIFLLTE